MYLIYLTRNTMVLNDKRSKRLLSFRFCMLTDVRLVLYGVVIDANITVWMNANTFTARVIILFETSGWEPCHDE